ncbi:hypothetical protein [Roseovarius sp. 217]|uniref:hypothetical protein n=1 Tax=Roseovarius sp. (strain 217) TaxID=314264 RepID=UPI0000687013|nr:hypothetical protein [Roseovarius sp. 217]EAQ23583.1 hypothetical protein ROS217_07894 [Roseovarius sp. 217]
MNEDLLREISKQYLLPLFSGASLDASSESSSTSEATVAYLSPQKIGFKVNKSDIYRLVFRRDQPFAQKKDPAREIRVVEAFSSILAEMNDELKGDLKSDLLSTFQRRVVARAVSEESIEVQVLRLLDQMSSWSARLYEGTPITCAIGIDPSANGDKDINFDLFVSNDVGAVLSNGYNSMLTFDEGLSFTQHLSLNQKAQTAPASPLMQSAISSWTANRDGRVAVALNGYGELLVFRDGQLLFSRRNGIWHFLTHSPILGQMAVPRDPKIRGAIYESVLDASFGRRGACLGIVGSSQRESWHSLVSEFDRLDLRTSEKTKALSAVVQDRPFHELDRTLRSELLSIDGATLLDHKGNVLAVGAIVMISNTGDGGGRTSAAQGLARYGLGIKISQDGSIIGYRPKSSGSSKVSPAFRLM